MDCAALLLEIGEALTFLRCRAFPLMAGGAFLDIDSVAQLLHSWGALLLLHSVALLLELCTALLFVRRHSFIFRTTGLLWIMGYVATTSYGAEHQGQAGNTSL